MYGRDSKLSAAREAKYEARISVLTDTIYNMQRENIKYFRDKEDWRIKYKNLKDTSDLVNNKVGAGLLPPAKKILKQNEK